MRIALDFDDTYTLDPMLWADFIDNAHYRGHSVTIVTGRPDDGDNNDIETSKAVLVCKCPVIYTEYNPKRLFCRSLGHTFDVWIDDSPQAIVDYENIEEDLNP